MDNGGTYQHGAYESNVQQHVHGNRSNGTHTITTHKTNVQYEDKQHVASMQANTNAYGNKHYMFVNSRMHESKQLMNANSDMHKNRRRTHSDGDMCVNNQQCMHSDMHANNQQSMHSDDMHANDQQSMHSDMHSNNQQSMHSNMHANNQQSMHSGGMHGNNQQCRHAGDMHANNQHTCAGDIRANQRSMLTGNMHADNQHMPSANTCANQHCMHINDMHAANQRVHTDDLHTEDKPMHTSNANTSNKNIYVGDMHSNQQCMHCNSNTHINNQRMHANANMRDVQRVHTNSTMHETRRTREGQHMHSTSNMPENQRMHRSSNMHTNQQCTYANSSMHASQQYAHADNGVKYAFQPAENHNISNWSFQLDGPTPSQIAARHATPNQLPLFNGDPEEWPIFISSFENSTMIGGYTHAENLVRLQASLKGKALEMVKSKLLLPAMVPDIIRTLKMRFGRPEFIIESLIEKIKRTSPVREKLDALIDLALNVQNICATMEACSLHSYMHNPMLVKGILEKLPNQSKMSWAMHPKTSNQPILKIFSEWMYTLAEAASQVISPSAHKRNESVHTHHQVETQQFQRQQQEQRKCVYCDKVGHEPAQCNEFKNLNVQARWEVVRNKRLCRQCLKSHRRRCFSNKPCGTNGCIVKHHPLLHHVNVSNSQSINSHNSNKAKGLFRIIPITISTAGKNYETFAFLDEGSSVTLIDKATFSKLKINGVRDPLCLRWTGDQQRNEENSVKSNITISNANKRFTLRDVRTVDRLGLPPQTLNVDELSKEYPHLKGLPITSYKDARPTILIGTNNWNLAVPLKVKEGKWREPIATKCRLGWSIQGTSQENINSFLNIHNCECQQDYNKLHGLVKEQFELETPKDRELTSAEHQRALHILNSTTRKIGNRFEAGLLWKTDDIQLPNSYETAFKRLMCLQRKLERNPSLKKTLENKINDL